MEAQWLINGLGDSAELLNNVLQTNQTIPPPHFIMTGMIMLRIRCELKLSEFAIRKPVAWSGKLWRYRFYLWRHCNCVFHNDAKLYQYYVPLQPQMTLCKYWINIAILFILYSFITCYSMWTYEIWFYKAPYCNFLGGGVCLVFWWSGKDWKWQLVICSIFLLLPGKSVWTYAQNKNSLLLWQNVEVRQRCAFQ